MRAAPPGRSASAPGAERPRRSLPLRGSVAVTGVLSLFLSTASAAAASAPGEASPTRVEPLRSSPRGGVERRAGAQEPAASLSNVALGRPCRPEPACFALVDGSQNLTLRPATRSRQQHADRANGTGIEPGDTSPAREGEAFASGSYIARTFTVFLREKVSVTQVIIFCGPARGGNLGTGGQYRRKLVVTTWVGELTDAPAEGREGGLSHRGQELSAKGAATRWEKDIALEPSSLGANGSLRVLFQVEGLATAISVAWAALPEGSGCGDCGELEITEVAVMARPAPLAPAGGAAVGGTEAPRAQEQLLRLDDGRGAESSTRLGRSMVAVYPPPTTSGEAGSSVPEATGSPMQAWKTKEPYAQAAARDRSTRSPAAKELATPAAGRAAVTTSIAAHVPALADVAGRQHQSVKLVGAGPGAAEPSARKPPTTSPPTTLMPDGAGARAASTADVAEAVDLDVMAQPGFLARSPGAAFAPATAGYVGNMPILTWIAIVAVTVMLIPRCCCLSAKGLADFTYDRLPEAEPESATLPSEAGADWWFDGPIPATPVATSRAAAPIADSEASRAQLFNIGSPDASRSPSPAPLARTRSSETEPEGEPGSDTNSAHSRVGSSGSSSSYHAAAPFQPSPVVLGCPQPAALSAPAPRASTGRVALLYASPLCYRDPTNRPTPMPQIPFEREWSNIVQAYDEAAVALREAPCSTPSRQGAGRPLVRRPGAILAAQPLTAGSLQRTVAPVAAGSAASIVHLSAHGVRDCLVLEDGQGTAHFLSCDMLRRMLDLGSEPFGVPSAGGLRLVILNACSLHAIGKQFVQGGVPHVICSSNDLRDSASLVFLRNLYSNLFQGSSIARAFEAARVALRSDSEAATRAAADHFVLLPEGFPHTEVLFEPEWSSAGGPEKSVLGDAQVLASRWRLPTGFSSDGTFSARSTTAQATGSSTEGPDESGCSDGPHSSDESLAGGGYRVGSSSSSDSEESGHLGDEAGAFEEARLLPARGREPVRRGGRLPGAGVAELLVGRRRALRPEAPPPGRYAKPLLRRGPCASGSPTVPAVQHSLFGRAVPPVPEDFVGRALDAWSVLQHLSSRRAVVVCGAQGEDHGVGKSAVLDAVHRAFALQMGGVCVAVQLQSLSDADASAIGVAGWIEKVASAVRQATWECREQWWPTAAAGAAPRPAARTLAAARPYFSGSVLRRRPMRGGAAPPRASSSRAVSCGFHALSDPIAVEAALRELVVEMATLSDLCEARCREWPAASGRILLLLDECDHLIQQKHFQDAVADLLQNCPSYRLVLSTHQRMVGTAGGRFKVVHQEVEGLPPADAARLFLRRAQRPLRWGELLAAHPGGSQAGSAGAAAMAAVGAQDVRAPVVIRRENETAVLSLVAAHPSVAAQRGNPRRLIELASRLGPATASLADLAPAQECRVGLEALAERDVRGDLPHDGELAPLLGCATSAAAGGQVA